MAKSFYSNVICDDTAARLKYYKWGEAFLPLSALMEKSLFIFWDYRDGQDG